MMVPWIFAHHGEIIEPARTHYVRLQLHALRAGDNSRSALRRVGDRPIDDGGRAEPSRVARTYGYYLVVVWPINNLVQVQTQAYLNAHKEEWGTQMKGRPWLG